MHQNNIEVQPLLDAALQARVKAYVPYSGFRVGAAFLMEDGEIITGCNIENASYGLSVCAERVALWKAVSEGKKAFKALVVVAEGDKPVAPCGACRQTIMEFAPDIPVYMYNTNGDYKIMQMSELLPESFKASDFWEEAQ